MVTALGKLIFSTQNNHSVLKDLFKVAHGTAAAESKAVLPSVRNREACGAGRRLRAGGSRPGGGARAARPALRRPVLPRVSSVPSAQSGHTVFCCFSGRPAFCPLLSGPGGRQGGGALLRLRSPALSRPQATWAWLVQPDRSTAIFAASTFSLRWPPPGSGPVPQPGGGPGEHGNHEGPQAAQDEHCSPERHALRWPVVARVDKVARMREQLQDVVHGEQRQPQVVQVEQVGARDVEQVQADVDQPARQVLQARPLEVELGQRVAPVGQLCHVEELGAEGPGGRRCTPQAGRLGQAALGQQHRGAPHARHQVEGAQLARLIEASLVRAGLLGSFLLLNLLFEELEGKKQGSWLPHTHRKECSRCTHPERSCGTHPAVSVHSMYGMRPGRAPRSLI